MIKLLALIPALLLAACATDQGMMPRSDEPGPSPWGYEDMCNDPERRSPEHCDE
jgi:hypothetical protein